MTYQDATAAEGLEMMAGAAVAGNADADAGDAVDAAVVASDGD